MSCYQDIRSAWMEMRKERSSHAPFLGTVVANMTSIAKAQGKSIPSDNECQSVLSKYAKGLQSILAVSNDPTADAQLKILDTYMVKQFNEQQLTEIMSKEVFGMNKGMAMRHLRGTYGSKVDMKMAAELFDQHKN